MTELIMTEQGLLDWMDVLAGKRNILEAKKADFERENADLIADIEKIEAEIKTVVLEKGETVKTDRISAIWNKGKETWDGKILTGYAVAHPEILAAKKVGKPTVSFRMNKS